ncbi:hypothetical protein [Streptomyces sp. NBC_01428]|uniref:hypothetical protein n=1 Tax=Streptomyces sp. NBC_01428 TaxID=2903861 RepID=UPI002E2FDD37|nr:hypothetical protein [Streptomyces sp. NBC_01428]
MKRHYTRTLTGFQCCACREEFSTKQEFAKHCGRGGRCKHPIALGFTIDLNVSPHHWMKAA